MTRDEGVAPFGLRVWVDEHRAFPLGPQHDVVVLGALPLDRAQGWLLPMDPVFRRGQRVAESWRFIPRNGHVVKTILIALGIVEHISVTGNAALLPRAVGDHHEFDVGRWIHREMSAIHFLQQEGIQEQESVAA